MRTALVFFGITIGWAQSAEQGNPRTSAADVAAGAKTFRSHCAPCHGLEGTGGRGPNLAAGKFYHGSSDADLLKNISEGIPGTEMPTLFYNEDRIWQIIAYIRSLNAAARPQAMGNPAKGAEVFRSKGCVQCHRISGEGGRLGPDLTHIGKIRSSEYLRQSLIEPNADVPLRYWWATFKDSGGASYAGFILNQDTYTVQLANFDGRLQSVSRADVKNYAVEKTSKMPSYKSSLTQEELTNLVAYLSSLRPAGEQP